MARTAAQIVEAIRGREQSAADVAAQSLAAMTRTDPAINAFTQVFEEEAMAQAEAIDRRLADGEDVGPLAGVPIAIKDNICLSFGRTTAGSRMLESYHSPYSATALQRLMDAGAVVVGKTNMDEFGMGSSTEHSAFGPTKNPWDTSRTPGGSSGGSAAAVAAGCVPVALGSDTGGSIRQPASYCGVVGFKPSYGRVSRYGLVAFASSLDQIGPIANTVRDAAIVTSVMAGEDLLDATSLPEPAPSVARPAEFAKLGVVRSWDGSPLTGAAAEAVDRAIAIAESIGLKVEDIELPFGGHGVAAYYVIAPAEASSNLARYDGIRYGRRAELAPGETLQDLYERSRSEGFGDEVQRRIMLGTYTLSAGYYDAYYATAQKARQLIRKDYLNAFEWVDAVLLPATMGPAFELGAMMDDALAMYLEDAFTVGASLAGLPAIAIRAGQEAASGLPIGVQLVGRPRGDAELLSIAEAIENASPEHARSPLAGG